MQLARTLARSLASAIAVIGVLGWVGASSPVRAQGTQKTEAEFVSYDAAAGKLTVRVTEGGDDASLERGQLVTFAVKPAGSVLDKTAVSSRGARVDLSQVAEGQRLSLYWQWQSAGGDEQRFARRIDVAPAAE